MRTGAGTDRGGELHVAHVAIPLEERVNSV